MPKLQHRIPRKAVESIISYSVSTNFCQELIEPSTREVLIFWTGRESQERRREYDSSLARLKTASELKNCRPSTSPADGYISFKLKLVDTLYLGKLLERLCRCAWQPRLRCQTRERGP